MEQILLTLEIEGFDERTDPELYSYLETWLVNNQFMEMTDPVALFVASRGYVQYKATGHVVPDED